MNRCVVQRDESILFSDVKIADHFATRLIGLLKTAGLNENQGLLLNKCSQIHTFGMKFSIDAIFLSKDGEILHIEKALAPGKVSPHISKTVWVLEVRSGSCDRLKIDLNQQLTISQ